MGGWLDGWMTKLVMRSFSNPFGLFICLCIATQDEKLIRVASPLILGVV